MTAKDTLVLDEDRGHRGYRIWWFCADIDEIGAMVGESPGNPPKTDDPEEILSYREFSAVHETAKKLASGYASGGFYWEERAAAQRALTLCNAALRATRSTENPWPAWALEAVAAGWKAPKGWKP